MAEKDNKKVVSINDVAKRAGVSITTVSRVINNFPSVSAKNRSKVEEAVAYLRFKPNVSAQRLARGYNNAIGLVIPGYPGVFHSFYAMELVRGVGHACEALKLDMVFHISNGLSPLNTNNVGGIIFADVIENRKQIDSTLEAGIPCVIINNIAEEFKVSFIGIDNRKGGELAADYLSSLGHNKIATITGNVNTQSGQQRLEGFKKVLDKKKIDLPKEYILYGDYSRRSARASIEKLMALPKPPTAVFAASDDMALEAMAFLMERGMKVPENVSIIGFDDNPQCIYAPVALTTIRQPLFQMAEESVKLLSNIMNGKQKEIKKLILPPDLVVRDSCASLRK